MLKKTFMLPILFLLLNLLPTGTALARQPAEDGLNFADYALNVVDYTLPNGLRVLLAEDHSAPVVAVNITYHVGGANDPAGRSGFAHLFEHMMFEGSANIANDQYFTLLEAIGADNNAYTANDKTVYWEVAPATELPRVLWMESDRMASLAVTQAAFDTQRQVVIEEYNQRVANAPYGVSNRRLFTLPMQGYPPYEQAVIGSIADLQAATLPQVQAFFNTYYRPNNATLAIVGDINMEETQALVQAYFADIPAGELPPPILARYPLPEQFPAQRSDPVTGRSLGYEETLVDPQVQLPRLAAAVVGPPRGAPDFYALDLLVDILSSGDSSRFEQRIIRQGKAAAAFTGLADYLGASIVYTVAFPNGGDSVETVRDLIWTEYDDVIANGVTQAELDRVKKQVLVKTITSYRESVQSSAEWLQDAVLNFGDPAATAKELDLYRAVTLADIQRAAQTYLFDRPMNILITLPQGEEIVAENPGLLVEPVNAPAPAKPLPAGTPPANVDEILAKLPAGVVNRTAAPAPLPVGQSEFPPFETFTLDNGLTVIFVRQPELPKLSLQLYVGGSNAAAPANRQGVADFMAELLTKGTAIRSAAQIAQTIEAAGGSVRANASLEWVSLAVEALSLDARLAFNLLDDLARHPTFPQKEFDIIKEQTLTFLEQDEVDPDTLANRQFGRVAYGGHPYGFYTAKESVQNLTRANVVNFYSTYFAPNNALLVIVGDISAAEARAQTRRVFDGWPRANVPDYLAYPAAELGQAGVIYLVDRPDSEQATIQIGNRAINARSPERYALEVVNTALGGGASSRLFNNLREEKGYTYGIYSRFGKPNDTSTFRVLSDVSQDHAGNAIREILAELQRIRTEELSAEELAAAKGLLIGNFALSIEAPADFAAQLATRYLTGVPVEELNRYLQNLEAVTAAGARQAAAEYIDSDQPIIVVVGNAALVQPQLEEIAPVVVVDKDGKTQ